MSALPLVVIALALSGAADTPQVRLSTECQAGDQEACARLARLSQSPDVRLTAIRKLTDQRLLADLARTDKDPTVRLAAIRSLIDQDALVQIARQNHSPVERGAAVERLVDPSVLADIARKDTSKWVRRKAAYCLTDEREIDRLVAENRKELLPTITIGAGLKHVMLDGKELKETLIGVATILPGRHTFSADFAVRESVNWEAGSVTTTDLLARLGASYFLEAEVGVVHWEYVAPAHRQGEGTWKLIVREEISTGPNLLPALLRR
jgi:hypothetical protein